MDEYAQGRQDYMDGVEGSAEPKSAEYLRGWFDQMDFEAGFRD